LSLIRATSRVKIVVQFPFALPNYSRFEHIKLAFFIVGEVYVLNTCGLIKELGEGSGMVYCPKCGNEVDEAMAFCPRCGAPLKATGPVQATPVRPRNEKAEKGEKQEKQEKQEPEKGEKQEKGQFGYVGWLIGGLILIIIGFLALLQISNIIPSGISWALVLLIVGVIVIISAVYFASMARKRYPQPS